MTDNDRIKSAFDRLVRGVFARIDYLALYPARVVSQNDDGSLELQPVDPRIPGMSRVPITLGLPGVEVLVEPDSYVLLGFSGGNPTSPTATLWQANSLKALTLTAKEQVKVVCQDAIIEASGDVNVKGLNATVEASANAEVKGASVKVEATGTADVSGAVLRLNGGSLPVARVSDQVQAGPFSGVILPPGALTVLG